MDNSCDKLEIEFDDRVIHIWKNSIVLIQALWRGAVTRKRLRHVRQIYSEIFKELEEDSGLHVHWPSKCVPCKPEFYKTYDYQKLLEKEKIECTSKSKSESISIDTPDSSNQVPNIATSYLPGETLTVPPLTFAQPQCSQQPISSVGPQSNLSDGTKQQETQMTHVLEEEPVRDRRKSGDDLVPVRDVSDSYKIEGPKIDPCSPVQQRSVTKDLSGDNLENERSNKEMDTHQYKQLNQDAENMSSLENVQDSPDREEETLIKSPLINRQEIDSDLPITPANQITGAPHVADVEKELQSLSAEELCAQRQTVAMELLWIQQAIESRKQYLQLKTEVTTGP